MPDAMLPAEVRRQVRLLRLRARRAAAGPLGGAYRSAFKGAGVTFEEVHEYQPGDDVRTIDWNVTARTGRPFVKRFTEERERTLLLVCDWSASMEFGSRGLTKRRVAAELAAVLALSAAGSNDRVSLLGFSDRAVHFVPPGRGGRHALRIAHDALAHRAARPGTDLGAALDLLARFLHRRGAVVLLSDFRGEGYERALTRAARRQDLVAVRVTDPREDDLPDAGLIAIQDSETGARALVDTSDFRVRQAYADDASKRRAALRRLTREAGADLVEVSTDGSHYRAFFRFLRRRQEQPIQPKRRRRANR